MADKFISIVIPVFNEKENLNGLYGELSNTMRHVGMPYELIFVDDGSIDGSAAIIKGFAEKDKFVRAVIFKRNYGQTAAIVAGIDASSGGYVVAIDADMQNDPADIGQLIRKMDEGYDLVSGWRRRRKDTFITRRLPSILANFIISKVTGVKLHDYGCTLKAYKKDFFKNINLYGEMHRFIPVYVYWMGGRIAELEVNHRPRKAGRSKYGINRTLKVLLDLMTVKFLLGHYSTSPLYFFGKWGFFMILAGFACAIETLVEKFVFGSWVHNNPMILLSIFFLIVGTQIVLMGLLAELSMRIYYETTKKAIYTVEEKVNC